MRFQDLYNGIVTEVSVDHRIFVVTLLSEGWERQFVVVPIPLDRSRKIAWWKKIVLISLEKISLIIGPNTGISRPDLVEVAIGWRSWRASYQHLPFYEHDCILALDKGLHFQHLLIGRTGLLLSSTSLLLSHLHLPLEFNCTLTIKIMQWCYCRKPGMYRLFVLGSTEHA